MATYTVASLDANGARVRPADFKYRRRSRDGHPTARREIERRRAAGDRVVLTKWENYQSKDMDPTDGPGG